MSLPRSVSAWQAQHVLALPPGASLEVLTALARTRFPAAKMVDGALRLSRHAHLFGPVTDEPLREELGFAADTPLLFALECPRERGEPPFLGLPERTGIARACPNGMPIRAEARVLNWAVAVARRLNGALRVTPSQIILRPDIESSVDLTVLSQVWLDPDAAQKVVATALPHVDFHRRAIPSAGHGTGEVEPSEAYGLGADLGADGRLDVLIGIAEDMPPALGSLWSQAAVISYQIRWTPVEIEDLELEEPPLETRIARRRAFDLTTRIAARVHEAIGGYVLDDDWFLVDPSELT